MSPEEGKGGYMKAVNTLLIEAEQILRRSAGKAPVRNRKLWINRSRPVTQWLKRTADALSKGEPLPDAPPQWMPVNDWRVTAFVRKRERSAAV